MEVIAQTDRRWYEFLRASTDWDTVNFWTPTDWRVLRIQPGERWYFRLRNYPGNKLCGYGYFDRDLVMPAEEAWARFGRANGRANREEFMQSVGGFGRETGALIGCALLKDPVFFDEDELPDIPTRVFTPNTQKFKYWNDREHGSLLDYLQISDSPSNTASTFQLVAELPTERWLALAKDRSTQGRFRREVLRAYGNRCAITGETCTDALEPVHIQEYRTPASNHVQNGLALRKDLHALFHRGLLTITPDYVVRVSSQIPSNSEYRRLDGLKITLPARADQRASKEALAYHMANVFRP